MNSSHAVRALVSILFLTAWLTAQEPFSFRIETTEEGIYRVQVNELRGMASLDHVRAEDISLTRNGVAVPIEIFGGSDGRLDPGDEIIFLAPRVSGENQKTQTFILSDHGVAARLKHGDPESARGEALVDGRFTVEVEENRVFESFATVQQPIIRGAAHAHWYWFRIHPPGAAPRSAGTDTRGESPTTAEIPLVLDPRPAKTAPGRLRLDLVGAVVDGIEQKIQVTFNGTDLDPVSWTTGMEKTVEFTVPGQILSRENMVRVTNLSSVPTYQDPQNEMARAKRNSLLIDKVAMTYDGQITGPGVSGKELVVHLAAAREATPRHLRIEHRHDEGYLVVDATAGRLWRSADLVVAGDKPVTLGICSLGGALTPVAVTPLRPTTIHQPGPGADYVVITTTDLKPILQPLLDHRAAEGLQTALVEARELYDTFTFGRFSPEAIRKFIAAASSNWKTKPRYVLLVGDADLDCNFTSQKETIPAVEVMTDYNGLTGTDALYGDTDGDGVPDIAVGRMPFRRREDLLEYIVRVINLEKRAPIGDWRRTATFFAGEGRFGKVIDGMLERVAAGVLADDIPAEFQVDMTYGNPSSAWYWPAPDVNRRLIERFNQGSLVFTYIGHGSMDGFDRVVTPDGTYPILRQADVTQLDNQGRSPVMAIIACSTGHYDAPDRDCIAEAMLTKPGGPIAVIAASRISHPYPNALLGKSLVAPFFDRQNRIGDVLVKAKRKMISEAGGAIGLVAEAQLSKAISGKTLIRDHLYLYNLFGDPAQRLPFPQALASIDAPERAAAGATLAVKATVEGGGDGEATVAIEARRDRFRAPDETGADAQPAAAGAEAVKARHARSNDTTVVRVTVPMKGGVIDASIALPADAAKGRYAVVVTVPGTDTRGPACGSKRLTVE